MLKCHFALVALALIFTPMVSAQAEAASVVTLHGLARSAQSMERMGESLQSQGYRLCNIGYPSRHHSIEVLATDHVLPQIEACLAQQSGPLHFVTHSLGGIIVRMLAARGHLPEIGRVVMLGPPNNGSEVVDKLAGLAPFRWLNGPAGSQLGTTEQSVPKQLGPAQFELGVIAGSSSINWLLSMLIPGDDDGKVSLASTRLEGMRDHLIVPVSHPFLMKNRTVMDQTAHFLRHGQFNHATR
ncbi:lipase [Oceanococcus atlanticus]|uniref:Lipase n=2 Tax=Oceanococcus atlanticus TaxID=1317117 RepID=A0A1Y1SGZ9_9GAMM|nr:lipase [Oceanococcus atlanticus]